MPFYMTQTMRSGALPAKKYFRRQTIDHPGHDETSAFTAAAKANYAAFNHIAVALVEVGTYASGQGIPTGTGTFEI